MQGSVSDFRRLAEERSGIGKAWWELCSSSRKHQNFVLKLNRLGSRDIQRFSPRDMPDIPDIDATVQLSAEEWAELEHELEELLKQA